MSNAGPVSNVLRNVSGSLNFDDSDLVAVRESLGEARELFKRLTGCGTDQAMLEQPNDPITRALDQGLEIAARTNSAQ